MTEKKLEIRKWDCSCDYLLSDAINYCVRCKPGETINAQGNCVNAIGEEYSPFGG